MRKEYCEPALHVTRLEAQQQILSVFPVLSDNLWQQGYRHVTGLTALYRFYSRYAVSNHYDDEKHP